jgi:hypothetical protein
MGLLVGREETFPAALIDRINSENVSGVIAEEETPIGGYIRPEVFRSTARAAVHGPS